MASAYKPREEEDFVYCRTSYEKNNLMYEATSNEKSCRILICHNNLALENFLSFTSLNFLLEATPKEKQTTPKPSVLSVANVG